MQNSAAVSSAGPGRDVSHADASDPAQLRMRSKSARAADRACEEPPFVYASIVAKRAAAGRRRPHGRLSAAGLPSAESCHPACTLPTLTRHPGCRPGLLR